MSQGKRTCELQLPGLCKSSYPSGFDGIGWACIVSACLVVAGCVSVRGVSPCCPSAAATGAVGVATDGALPSIRRAAAASTVSPSAAHARTTTRADAAPSTSTTIAAHVLWRNTTVAKRWACVPSHKRRWRQTDAVVVSGVQAPTEVWPTLPTTSGVATKRQLISMWRVGRSGLIIPSARQLASSIAARSMTVVSAGLLALPHLPCALSSTPVVQPVASAASLVLLVLEGAKSIAASICVGVCVFSTARVTNCNYAMS